MPLKVGGDVSAMVMYLAVVVASRGLWVLGLWLRLRAQEHREEARLRYLTAALALPAGRELAEVRPDGTSLRVVAAIGADGGGRG